MPARRAGCSVFPTDKVRVFMNPERDTGGQADQPKPSELVIDEDDARLRSPYPSDVSGYVRQYGSAMGAGRI